MADLEKNTSDDKCVIIFHKMTPEEEAAEIERLREKAIRDELSAMKYERRKGIEQGIEEERARAIALMREKGFTEEQIRSIFE